ncbi:GNAT family N-acetyltransferase [Dongia deserti]|uniref:GNAT family N-acetyltransferase n=1 Tax=Dongia deserti TaxID=2268030 RepID=UPI000E646CDA|nr:GNAT family N-acetyltransferase [Dongia deserti]
MNQIEIRLAESADIPALRELQERSMRMLGRLRYSATQIEAYIARIGTMDDYLVHDRTYLLAEADGEIVGCGGWTTRLPGYARHTKDNVHSPDPSRATVRSVFVEPLAARQGIGRGIMSAVENALRAAGLRTAELGATENSRGFYRSVGYQVLDPFHVDLGDRISMPLTRMRKALAPANSDESGPSLRSA